MNRAEKILKRIFSLPPAPTVLTAVPAFVLVIYVLKTGTGGLLAYFAYAFSAYGLTISLTGCWRAIRSLGSHPLTQKTLAAPLSRRLREDAAFRAELSLYRGFAVNLLYIVMKLAMGVYYRSLWFGFLAAYYALLAAMRFLLLCRRKELQGEARREIELRRYRLCGAALLLMNLALGGIVAFMVHENRSYEYPGTLIYAVAAYAFYAVITAIIHVIKYRRYGSPVLSAAKAINLVAAAVSLLSLETAMLARFGGGENLLFRKKMIGCTGGGICLLVLSMAVIMLVKASKQIKEIKSQNS